MLSAEAQGYPKAESNIYIFLLNYIVFTAVRASKEADLIRTGTTTGTNIFDFYP